MCALQAEKCSQQIRCDARPPNRRLNHEEVQEVSAEEMTRQHHRVRIEVCFTRVDPTMSLGYMAPDCCYPLGVAAHRLMVNGQQALEVVHCGDADASGRICHSNSLLVPIRVLRHVGRVSRGAPDGTGCYPAALMGLPCACSTGPTGTISYRAMEDVRELEAFIARREPLTLSTVLAGRVWRSNKRTIAGFPCGRAFLVRCIRRRRTRERPHSGGPTRAPSSNSLVDRHHSVHGSPSAGTVVRVRASFLEIEAVDPLGSRRDFRGYRGSDRRHCLCRRRSAAGGWLRVRTSCGTAHGFCGTDQKRRGHRLSEWHRYMRLDRIAPPSTDRMADYQAVGTGCDCWRADRGDHLERDLSYHVAARSWSDDMSGCSLDRCLLAPRAPRAGGATSIDNCCHGLCKWGYQYVAGHQWTATRL